MESVLMSLPSPATSSVAILAHQGGWDEILLVAGPMVVIVGLLAIVKRRIDTRLASEADENDSSNEESSHGVGSDALDRRSDSA